MTQEKSSQNPLLQAAARGELETVQTLLTAGGDPNVRNDLGQTPLHWAVGGSHMDVANALLKAGADPGARDNDGQTPLHVAVRKGEMEIFNILLKAGADPDAVNNAGQNTSHVTSKSGHEEVPNVLTKAGTDPQAIPLAGQAPLHLADLQSPQTSVNLDLTTVTSKASKTIPPRSNRNLIAEAACNLIRDDSLRRKGSTMNSKDDSHWPLAQRLLYRAVFAGHTDLVKALIEEGTSCDKMVKEVFYLWRAISQLEESNFYLIFDYPDKNKIEPRSLCSMSSLHCAALAGHIDIVNILIKVSGDTLNKKMSPCSWSPLHFAARTNHADVASALIQAGAELESKDSGEATPLCLALRYSNEEVASVLILAGADINAVPDSKRWESATRDY
ncbi:ankyrin repeat domain-containing protein [Candidatus Synechococcus spongiarum]|uniref:ankyrin repeat domain-containing protein n=1 Tax=Candidatus Synechococcus spongiarum TaxID=431041 RepID=UPI0004BA2038|nr:ankyrin repeat domain-containing protein [Candidatus Synechococcus spongiarum]